MIIIESLPKPSVLQTLDYETRLNELIALHQTKYPDWEPLEGDELLMMLEDFAYREVLLRAEFNMLSLAFFLSTATKEDLDNYAVFFGVERLQGSNPYADYEFSLSSILEQDVVIPSGLVLTDETSTYEAILLESATIEAGNDKVTGRVELQLKTSSSDIKTEIVTTPLPFVITATSKGAFLNGSSVESDEEFRKRIFLSMADKSTAGSIETYESFTFKADERIQDVKVLNGIKPLSEYVSLFFEKTEAEILTALNQLVGDMATVNVYYYSDKADELMQSRIENSLNEKEVRPLTDKVNVELATTVPYTIEADLKILPNQEAATIYSNAVESLNSGLKSLKQIGTDITLSEINDFLKVSGVKEVVITGPTENINVSDNEIGVNGVNTITYSII